jgi:hypothetical protein
MNYMNWMMAKPVLGLQESFRTRAGMAEESAAKARSKRRVECIICGLALKRFRKL